MKTLINSAMTGLEQFEVAVICIGYHQNVPFDAFSDAASKGGQIFFNFVWHYRRS